MLPHRVKYSTTEWLTDRLFLPSAVLDYFTLLIIDDLIQGNSRNPSILLPTNALYFFDTYLRYETAELVPLTFETHRHLCISASLHPVDSRDLASCSSSVSTFECGATGTW